MVPLLMRFGKHVSQEKLQVGEKQLRWIKAMGDAEDDDEEAQDERTLHVHTEGETRFLLRSALFDALLHRLMRTVNSIRIMIHGYHQVSSSHISRELFSAW